VGATRPEQIEETVAASGRRLGADVVQRLERLFPR
jgi:aryl-alcohol dehydrogenase-like predicted oxidoreductase